MKIKLITFSLHHSISILCILLITSLSAQHAYSQAEVEPWGNITGIRNHGQLYGFGSEFRITNKAATRTVVTGKEKQQPRYSRQGNVQTVTTRIDSLFFTETVADAGAGQIIVDIQMNSQKDTLYKGVYFCIILPTQYYAYSKVRLSNHTEVALSTAAITDSNYVNSLEESIQLIGDGRMLKVSFKEARQMMVRKDTLGNYKLFLPIAIGAIHKGETKHFSLKIEATGDVDHAPINLVINTAQPGRAFDGLGGNFRLQNPKTDPQVIDYSLKNLRVAWGRVEMPWRFWQPDRDTDPTEAANAGKLNPAVQHAMDMARRLDSLGMPVILSAWSAPNWAIVGPPNFRPTPQGVWGNPLDHSQMDAVYKSITDYILYVKAKYGFEYKLFSFNESDLGINIRLTGEEHAAFIKGLGAYMAAKGLKTKMLLGDNSDANTYQFIYPAMNDAAARPYIGAISFHSWRGWERATLQKWADAAQKLNLPLIVGEGSIDAAAWNYPDIFQESTYALEEINLYTRLLAICQPVSILQWQLTADYSPLIGGGIFNNNEELHPGQRFFNLKQLASTPKGLYAMPVRCDRPDISCAALGDNSKGIYTIHLVNNGGEHDVTLTGLPGKIKQLCYFITNNKLGMKQKHRINITASGAKFKLPATSFVTLISE